MTQTTKKTAKTIWIDLGYIGHKSDKLQELFSNYSHTPNKYGYYLKFENHTHCAINEGVTVETNCFKNEAQFKEKLLTYLIAERL